MHGYIRMPQYANTCPSICERNYQQNLEYYVVRVSIISTTNTQGGTWNYKILYRHFKRRDLNPGVDGGEGILTFRNLASYI